MIKVDKWNMKQENLKQETRKIPIKIDSWKRKNWFMKKRIDTKIWNM